MPQIVQLVLRKYQTNPYPERVELLVDGKCVSNKKLNTRKGEVTVWKKFLAALVGKGPSVLSRIELSRELGYDYPFVAGAVYVSFSRLCKEYPAVMRSLGDDQVELLCEVNLGKPRPLPWKTD